MASGAPKIPHSVGDWKAGFSGFLKPSLYEVVISGNGWENTISASGAGQYQALLTKMSLLHCESASFPGRAIGTQPNRIYGPVREFAYEGIYSGDVSLTFRMDSNMILRQIFSNWHEIIHNRFSGDFLYYDDYVANIKVYQYQNDREQRDKPIYGIEVEEAYPKSINPVDVGYEQRDTYMKQQVDFAFRRWRQLPQDEL